MGEQGNARSSFAHCKQTRAGGSVPHIPGSVDELGSCVCSREHQTGAGGARGCEGRRKRIA